MSLSCGFSDCRAPAYARWGRAVHLMDATEQAIATFLACQEHDDNLSHHFMRSEDPRGTGEFRIGLLADEVCWHQPHQEPVRPYSWRYRDEEAAHD